MYHECVMSVSVSVERVRESVECAEREGGDLGGRAVAPVAAAVDVADALHHVALTVRQVCHTHTHTHTR